MLQTKMLSIYEMHTHTDAKEKATLAYVFSATLTLPHI